MENCVFYVDLSEVIFDTLENTILVNVVLYFAISMLDNGQDSACGCRPHHRISCSTKTSVN